MGRPERRNYLPAKRLDPAGADGLFFGNPGQFGIQLVAVLVSWTFAFVGTYCLLKVVEMFIGLRVTKEQEVMGLDLSQHNEAAYS